MPSKVYSRQLFFTCLIAERAPAVSMKMSALPCNNLTDALQLFQGHVLHPKWKHHRRFLRLSTCKSSIASPARGCLTGTPKTGSTTAEYLHIYPTIYQTCKPDASGSQFADPYSHQIESLDTHPPPMSMLWLLQCQWLLLLQIWLNKNRLITAASMTFNTALKDYARRGGSSIVPNQSSQWFHFQKHQE